MGLEIFKLYGSIMVDNDKANESIKKTDEKAEGLSKKFLSGVKVAAAWGVGIASAAAAGAVACAKMAENLQQTQRKSQVIFGDMTSDVEEWALANERTFGLGSGTIQGYLNSIADITQGMGMAKEASLEMAQGTMELGAQLANWNGIGADEAMGDLEKAITGSHKAVEKYGIKLNDAVLSQTAMNMGLGDNFGALDEATKAQVRYQAIMDASGNAIDFWNEGNRNSTFYLTEMKEQFGNICEVIGGYFLPIFSDVTKSLADGAAFAASLVSEFASAYDETGSLKEAFKSLLPHLESLGINVEWLEQVFDGLCAFLSDTYNTMLLPLFEGVKEMFDDMGGKFSDNVGNMEGIFSNFASVIKGVWTDLIQPVWDFLLEYIFMIWDFFNENITNVMNLWNTMSEALKLAWDEILKPVIDTVMEWVRKLFDKFNEYMPEIQRVVDEVFSMINQLWETALKPAFEAIGWFLQNILLPVFDAIFTFGILPIVDTVFQTIIKLWDNSLKPMFEGIIDFIGGVFTGDWGRAWDGVVSIFSGIWEGLVTVAKAPLNAVINMVNTLINGLNTLQIPDWVPFGLGGKGINIPTIPMLYKGTDYFTPTRAWGNMALVGEQGPELVELPTGSKVNTAEETKDILGNGMTVNIYSPKGTASEIKRELTRLNRQLSFGL